MGTIFVRLSFAVSACLVCAAPILAQNLTPVEVAKKGKAAIAIIQSKSKTSVLFGAGGGPAIGPAGGFVPAGGGFKGGVVKTSAMLSPAFCVHPEGLYLTSYTNAPGGSVQVMVRPGQEDQQSLVAPVVRSDKDSGLALIWIPSPTKVPPLSLGSAKDLADADAVVAFGFPPRTANAVLQGLATTSNLTVKSVKVVASNNPPGNHFHLSASPGGSGGPVLDARGQILGMILGEDPNGPVVMNCEQLKQFLTAPVLVTAIPAITAENLHQPLDFQAQVIDLFPTANAVPFNLELVLKADSSKEQRYTMTAKNGVYRVTTIPLAAPKEKPRFEITVAFPDGTVTGTIAEQTIQVEGKTYPLGSLRQVHTKGTTTTTLFADGTRLEITPPAALPTLAVSVGGKTWDLDLAKATEVRLQPVQNLPSIACTVVAQQQGKETARSEKLFVLATETKTAKNLANVDPQFLDMAKKSTESMFGRYDADGNGKIDQNEASPTMARNFTTYDTNRDGFLTQDEYMQYYINMYTERYGTNPPPGGNP